MACAIIGRRSTKDLPNVARGCASVGVADAYQDLIREATTPCGAIATSNLMAGSVSRVTPCGLIRPPRRVDGLSMRA